MKQRLDEQTIALRAAKEFWDGTVVNLGFGMPGHCSRFIPEGRRVIFHSENGALGYGPELTADEKDKWDLSLIDASARFISWAPGMSLFDEATCFGMVRGGHIDITVLGALEVSEKGDLASLRTPGRPPGGFILGGAMDLAVGAKKLIVTMQHTTRDGQPKILKQCTRPLTARECVNLIVTDLAVIEVTKQGLVLKEIAPGWRVEEVQVLTGAPLSIASDLKEITL